ncbi:MAG TPA: addiction module protein [Opitutaceae bacterium]|nr:addiction module protein [Opitutaceae bacterium]
MPITVQELFDEARKLPPAQASELMDLLLVKAVEVPDAEVEAAWRREIQRRIAEIESGRETGVDGDEVMAELRQIVGS